MMFGEGEEMYLQGKCVAVQLSVQSIIHIVCEAQAILSYSSPKSCANVVVLSLFTAIKKVNLTKIRRVPNLDLSGDYMCM